MPPRVSVLMSVYNGAPYLELAVQSILSQTYDDFEFIIVNDGSTDDTDEILGLFADTRIVRICNPNNIGLTRSLNLALRQASGEFIARQDSDDISMPEKLSMQTTFLESHPEYGLVGCATKRIDSVGKYLQTVIPPASDLEICKKLFQRNPMVHGSVIARKSLIDAVGGYREHFITSQDYDLWMRLSEISFLSNLPHPLYFRRMHSQSVGTLKRKSQARFSFDVLQMAIERLQGGNDRLGFSITRLPGTCVSEWAKDRWRICGQSEQETTFKLWLKVIEISKMAPSKTALISLLFVITKQNFLNGARTLKQMTKMLLGMRAG